MFESNLRRLTVWPKALKQIAITKKRCKVEKEDLLRDLEQVRAEASRTIAELKDQVREEVSLFKLVKNEQGYIDRA